jgi:hypothetical protein
LLQFCSIAHWLIRLADLLRCSGQRWRFGLHDCTLFDTISHWTQFGKSTPSNIIPLSHTNNLDCRGLSPGMGIFTRWRPSIFELLSLYQQTHSLPACASDWWISGDKPHPGPPMSDQQCCNKRFILPLCRKQLLVLGNSNLLPSCLGPRTVLPRRVLYRSS